MTILKQQMNEVVEIKVETCHSFIVFVPLQGVMDSCAVAHKFNTFFLLLLQQYQVILEIDIALWVDSSYACLLLIAVEVWIISLI